MTSYCPDAFLVVLAVDDSSSLDQAENILSYLARAGVLDKPTILVANKADLVRNRVVKTAGRINDTNCLIPSALFQWGNPWHRNTISNILKHLLVS